LKYPAITKQKDYKMELEYTKNGLTHSATGETGVKFSLTFNPETKTYLVKQGTKIVNKAVKGIIPAKELVQAIEDSLNEEEEEEEEETEPVPAKTRTKTVGKAIPVPAKKVSVPVTAKIKPFPDFEKWVINNVTLLPVPKSGIKKAGIEEQNRKTLMGAKLKHGKARAAYNREHGIETEATAKAVTVREPKVKPEKMTSEERFGEKWNNFGEAPTPFEYALAQLTNARSSRDYGVVHGRLHPHSIVARDSYRKCVERCYINEEKLYRLMQAEPGQKLPKGFVFEYFNERGVPSELVGEPEEDYSALEHYKFTGFGKAGLGEGVTLPIKITTKAK
jgi:hypothetical protein